MCHTDDLARATNLHRRLLLLLNWHFWPQQEGTKVCELFFSQFSYQTRTTRRLNSDSCHQMLYVQWHWRFGSWRSEWFRRHGWERQWERFWEIIIQNDNFTSRRAEKLNPGCIFIIILDGTLSFYTEGKKGGINITQMYRNRDAGYPSYFNELVYCYDVEGVLMRLGIQDSDANSSKLFIDHRA